MTGRIKRNTIAITLMIMLSIILFSSFNMPGKSRHASRYEYSLPTGYELEELRLEDGEYTGTATGFQPGLVVSVAVKNGEVDSIEVTDHNEIGRQYWLRPLRLIPTEILKRQQTDVDVVSGATATSKAIMAAVENALIADSGEETE